MTNNKSTNNRKQEMNNKKQATSYKEHKKHQATTNNQPVPPQQCSTGNKAGQCQLDDSSAKQMQLLQRFMDNQRVTEWLEASNNSKKGSNKCGDKVNAQQHRQKEDRGQWSAMQHNCRDALAAATMGQVMASGKVEKRERKLAEWLQSTNFFLCSSGSGGVVSNNSCCCPSRQ